MQKDATEFVKRCNEFQRYKAPIRRDEMPLRPMMGAHAFAKWGIDFVRPIDPPAARTHAQYIIVATDFMTKLRLIQKIMPTLPQSFFMKMFSPGTVSSVKL